MKPLSRCLLLVLASVWLFAAPGAAQAAEEPRLALIIGNSQYPESPLSNPVNDASLIGDTLTALGFTVYKHLDVTQAAMKRAVLDFGDAIEAAGPNTVTFIYYAGHGVQIGGENFLIPVDAQIKRERDVPLQAVAASEILSVLAFSDSRLNMVVLDACRNNPYARSFRSNTRGLARLDAPRGTLLAYSTSPGDVALDGRGANSPYAEALSRAFFTAGAKVEEVFKRTRIDVMKATEDAQVPWETSSLTGDFYFNPEDADTGAGVVAAANAEVVYWQSVSASGDPQMFEYYLRKYPQGIFSSIAKRRIAMALQQVAAVPVSRLPAPQPALDLRKLSFVPGTHKTRYLAANSECDSVSVGDLTATAETMSGIWRHPDASGDITFSHEDGIVKIDFEGDSIVSVRDTVQIQGDTLFVRLDVKYMGGRCKFAFSVDKVIAR